MSTALKETPLVLDLVEADEHPTPAVQRAGNVVALPSNGPMAQALAFLQGGGTPEQLEKMMDLQDRFNRDQAHREYIAAMTEFKKVAPIILKDKHVEFKTDKGITAYNHATLGNVVESVIKVMAEYGFTHDWDSVRDGDRVKVTCILTHIGGHSKKVSMEAPLDQSGGKNNIQAMISSNSYLERHTLLAVTGLATKEQDDDARGAGDAQSNRRELWAGKAAAAQTARDLQDVRRDGTKAFQDAKDREGYASFAAAVKARAAQLEHPNA